MKKILPLFLGAFLVAFNPTAAKADTVVEIAAGNDDFSTLVAAVKAAGLVETLSGPGPFTVFAPTNEAFAALPAGTVETLLKPENKEKLTGILTYHVVPRTLMAADVVEAIKAGGGKVSVKTVNGEDLEVTMEGDSVVLKSKSGGTAKVVKTDLKGDNGVIHVIDAVLLP
ncbi:MAG: fasciclin domain-containing protein [Verrucomicrobiota bacterium]